MGGMTASNIAIIHRPNTSSQIRYPPNQRCDLASSGRQFPLVGIKAPILNLASIRTKPHHLTIVTRYSRE